jgi:DNA-binding NarL/FixJ family response regulator
MSNLLKRRSPLARKIEDREYKRILELKAIGLTAAVIAERLGVSRKTVQVYLRANRLNLKPYEVPSGA